LGLRKFIRGGGVEAIASLFKGMKRSQKIDPHPEKRKLYEYYD
jgi:hypothetical protein